MAMLNDEPKKPKAKRTQTPKKKADIVEVTDDTHEEPEPYDATQLTLRLTKMAVVTGEPIQPKAKRTQTPKKDDAHEEPEPYDATQLTFGELTPEDPEPIRVATPPRDIPKPKGGNPRPTSAKE